MEFHHLRILVHNIFFQLLVDEVARDLIGHSAASSIVGEVMNLDDFLDEVAEPDPKYSPRREHHHVESSSGHPTGGRVFNPLANLG